MSTPHGVLKEDPIVRLCVELAGTCPHHRGSKGAVGILPVHEQDSVCCLEEGLYGFNKFCLFGSIGSGTRRGGDSICKKC